LAYQSVVKAEINKSIRDSSDAYDRYEDFVSQNFCKLSYRIQRDSDFRIHSRLQSVDGFMVGRFTTSAGKGDLIRTRAAINKDGESRFALYVPIKGEQELQQFSHVERCGPGSLALVSMSEPFIQRKLGDNDTVYFFMPSAFVDQRMIRGENICGRPMAINTGVRRLVYSSVMAFQREAAGMTDVEFRCATRILGELVLFALDGSGDLSTNTRSVRSSNLARAKRVIRARFTDTEFKISDVAKECGISVRYLHELFRADGNTVSEYLKQQRLQLARHMLENAGSLTTVTDVCFSCGFSNAAQFSTAFRQAFSVSPRDVLRRIG
jgi:AraC-like DNA-binding protein